MSKTILITGGAGYIGSHCVYALIDQGYKAVIVDSLENGHQFLVHPHAVFSNTDLSDKDTLVELMKEHRVDAVMHFAAYAYVGESMRNPMRYFSNNVKNSIVLLEAMAESEVKQLVFSSSCATYGIPTQLPIFEDSSQDPISPYGRSKLQIEEIIKDVTEELGLSVAMMRYFNASGASEEYPIGEYHEPETHILPLLLAAVSGDNNSMRLFGDDYETTDGTCIRDYVHVADIAGAHLLALDYLDEAGGVHAFNLGNDEPVSLLELIQSVERVTGKKVPYTVEPRREGDPPALYADSQKAREVLGWEPCYPEIDQIVETAWAWYQKLQLSRVRGNL